MGIEIIIRQVELRDAEAIAGIYAPYVNHTPITFEEKAPDAAEMSRRITSFLEKCPYLVAEVDGKVIGYACASPHHVRASYRWSVNVAVYIGQGFHRRGIGRMLYGALLPLLKQQGFVMAYAGVTLPNPSSIGLHESIGFHRIATYRNVGFKLGEWRDVGWWELQLTPPPASPAEPVLWPAMPPFVTFRASC